MQGLLAITLVILAINGLFRGRALGYLLSCVMCVLVLVILQVAYHETDTFADAAYLFFWSMAIVIWTSFLWALCWLARSAVNRFKRRS
jgi:hypothetical protein